MSLGHIANLKESLSESFLIIKTCLTTFWFWVPVLLSFYIVLQLGIMFYIHPLALIIVPSILIIYAVISDDRRTKAIYGLDGKQSEDTGKKLLSDVDIERLVSEYNVMLKDRKKPQDDEN